MALGRSGRPDFLCYVSGLALPSACLSTRTCWAVALGSSGRPDFCAMSRVWRSSRRVWAPGLAGRWLSAGLGARTSCAIMSRVWRSSRQVWTPGLFVLWLGFGAPLGGSGRPDLLSGDSQQVWAPGLPVLCLGFGAPLGRSGRPDFMGCFFCLFRALS